MSAIENEREKVLKFYCWKTNECKDGLGMKSFTLNSVLGSRDLTMQHLTSCDK